MSGRLDFQARTSELGDLDRSGLRVAWIKLFEMAPPHHLSMTFMRKAIIFETQCRQFGGLSKTNKNGGFNQFYQNMTEVGLGDIVFSFADTFIKTVGVVSATARSAEKPKEFGKAGDAWDADGWLVQVTDHKNNRIDELLPWRYKV